MDAIDKFQCTVDKDEETFLKDKAIKYLFKKRGHTYLLLSEEAADNDTFEIYAYFTVSVESVGLQEPTNNKAKKSLSKTLRKEFTGDKNATHLPAVLIGQLAKKIIKIDDKTIYSAPVSAKDILDEAFTVIDDVISRIPCKLVIIECHSEIAYEKYNDYGFIEFQTRKPLSANNQDRVLRQMFMVASSSDDLFCSFNNYDEFKEYLLNSYINENDTTTFGNTNAFEETNLIPV